MGRAFGTAFGLLLIALALTRVAMAKTFNVGDRQGWTLPSAANGLNYSAWAAHQTFVVGDILHFHYTARAHNVQPLPSDSSFVACDFYSVTVPAFEGGSNDIMLKTAGDHWYACSVSEHCQNGMKFRVTVSEHNMSPTPAPAEVETPAPYFPYNGAPATYGLSPEPVPYFSQAPAGAHNAYLRKGGNPTTAPAPGYDFGGSFDGSPDAAPKYYETIPDPVSGSD